MNFVTFQWLVVAKKVTAGASNYGVGRGEAGGEGGWTIWHIPMSVMMSCGAHVVAICNLVARIGCRSPIPAMMNVNLNLITGLMMPQQRLITARRLPWYATTLTWYQFCKMFWFASLFFIALFLSLSGSSSSGSLCSLPHLWVRVTDALSQQAIAGHAHNMMPNNATPHCVLQRREN